MGAYDQRIFAAGELGSISGTVGTLPAGAELGEKRIHNGLTHRLCYNNGNSMAYPGHVLSAVPVMAATASVGSYSMTITTVSGTRNAAAAAVVHHATVATNHYFWGVTAGRLTSGLVCNAAVSASTGGLVTIDSNGGVAGITTMSLANPPVAMTLSSMTTGSTSPTRTGDVIVMLEQK